MTQPPQGNDPTRYGGQQQFGQPGYGQPEYTGGQPGYPGGYDQQPPKKNTGLIIAVGVIVLLLIAGAVGGFLLLRDDDTETDSTATDETTSAPTTSAETTPGETFCQRFTKNAESNEFDNPGPDDLPKVLAELQIFRQLAPPELQDDYDVLIDAVEDNGATDASVALQNIQTYAVDECGLV
ncbi:MAG: hypothetical protein M3381_02570, partial [Actinomycetota bacterium]|nr:hypothetical protein [Actinomycetota bacterium]